MAENDQAAGSPSLARKLVEVARELIDHAGHVEAEYLLRQAIRHDPLYLPAYALLGYVLEAQLRWDEAMDVFRVVRQVRALHQAAGALAGQSAP